MSELRLSASLYQRFLICPKSAAYSISNETKNLNKPSLGAALGLISHSLIENSVRIPTEWTTEQIEEWFENSWEQFVEEQRTKLEKEWSPNKVPKPQSWPGFFATRASAKTLVLKNSGLLPPKYPLQSGVIKKSTLDEFEFPLVEKYLESSDLGIFGKPDYVFLEDGKVVIYDYKFGRNQEDLDKHKFQMLFYQLLVESVLNVEVGKLAIVASANRLWEIATDRQELENLRNDIPRVLDAIKSNNVAAIPTSNNCRFCPFKIVCKPFKKAKIDLYPNRPMAISGEIFAIRKIDDDFQELTIKPELASEGESFRVFGIPNGYPLRVGESVFLTDNLEFLDDKIIGFAWNSRISLQG
ncbi:PD-(D/E)XK endonuclease-like domain, AddAB-type [Candidatus Nanopelagicaceae bacterium]